METNSNCDGNQSVNHVQASQKVELSMLLEDFFYDIFNKRGKQFSDRMKMRYRVLFQAMEEYFRRAARLSDLTDEAITAYAIFRRSDRQLSASTINRELDMIKSVWNWAAKFRYVPNFSTVGHLPEAVRVTRQRASAKPRPQRKSRKRHPSDEKDPRTGLIYYYENVYRPWLVRGDFPRDDIKTHDFAVRVIEGFCGDVLCVNEISPELLTQFQAHLGTVNFESFPAEIDDIVHAVERVVRAYNPPEFRKPDFSLMDPDPKPGTLRELFESQYRPQRLLGSPKCAVMRYVLLFRTQRRYFGHDIFIAQQTDVMAATFFQWLLDSGLSRVSVNGHRSTWFAVWRFANELGLIDRVPKVKKLNPGLKSPNAWTVEEINQILRNVNAAYPGGLIGGIPSELYWDALLRVTWWTGLRRGSLFKLRCGDMDLSEGWLTIAPDQIKNRRGKKFRLGPDAISAVSKIITSPERELLFPWTLHERAISTQFNRILQAAGIPADSSGMGQFHKIRRSTATKVAALGGIAEAAALLGHSTQDVTRLYIDSSKMPGQDATNLLPGLWRDKSHQPELPTVHPERTEPKRRAAKSPLKHLRTLTPHQIEQQISEHASMAEWL